MRSLPVTFNPARSGPPALITVVASWCSFCNEWLPQLKLMEPKLVGVRVYTVDGDHDPRAQEWQVDGYPSIYYRARKGGLYKYEGNRSLQGIMRFIQAVEK